MKKIGVVGHFAYGKNLLDGQTIKTKIVAEELDRVFGKKNVKKVDTHGNGLQKIISILKSVFLAFRCDDVVVITARNGVRVFIPVLAAFKHIAKCELHFSVIGGWISEHIENMNHVKKGLKKFRGIYVETSLTKKELNDMGYDNVFVMPNCKKLNVLKESELVYSVDKPYKLCMFSRVMKEKGMEDAVNAVKFINEKYGEMRFTLDIYGQVDPGQIEWFENFSKQFPDYVKYNGAVEFDKSTDVLKDYFALLFPTHYYTEGIPGTIIDAYAAGVPVIASKWKHCADIVSENNTGFLFDMKDVDGLVEKLEQAYRDVKTWNSKKTKCLEEAKTYLPEAAMKIMIVNF